MAITFLYLDLGQVLLHFDHRQAARQLGEVLQVTEEQAWEAVFESGLQDTFERGEISPEAFCQRLQQVTGSRQPTAPLLRAASDIFRPNQPMLDLLQVLRRGPQRLGLLSNTCQAHWDWIALNYPELLSAFETHVLSFEVGHMKPAPEIYRVAQQQAGVAAEQILFVDDRAENVAGAQACGIRSLQYHSPAQVREALESAGISINL